MDTVALHIVGRFDSSTPETVLSAPQAEFQIRFKLTFPLDGNSFQSENGTGFMVYGNQTAFSYHLNDRFVTNLSGGATFYNGRRYGGLLISAHLAANHQVTFFLENTAGSGGIQLYTGEEDAPQFKAGTFAVPGNADAAVYRAGTLLGYPSIVEARITVEPACEHNGNNR